MRAWSVARAAAARTRSAAARARREPVRSGPGSSPGRVAPRGRRSPPQDRAASALASLRWRVFQLIEPVEAHRLDDAVADHDQPGLAVPGVMMLMNGERRHIDEVPTLPFVTLRRRLPLIFELVGAVEPQVPMQVVAAALHDEQHLLPHVPVPPRPAL